MPRRLPAPWSIEELNACFIVRDASQRILAHIYFEDEDGCRTAKGRLTRDEARRIATNIAKLPALLKAH
jgi:hypothetical protein